MPKLKPAEIESRRQEIVAAARACFLRNGFHKTTTDEICREASITPGGLYHYFSGKNEIISAVIEQSAREVVDQLSALTEHTEDARDAFRTTSQFFNEMMFRPETENQTRLDIEIWAECLKDEKLYEANQESWSLRRKWMEGLLERSAAEGMYPQQNFAVQGLSSLYMAILIGLRVGKLMWRDEFDLMGAVRALFMMHAGQLAIDIPPLPELNIPGSATVAPETDANNMRPK